MEDFLELKLENKLELSMELLKFDRTIISRLKNAKIESLNISLRDLWTLDIKIPYFIQDELKHNKIKNKDYDLVKEEKSIRLKCGNSYAMFTIKDISIDTQNNYKIAKCYSEERGMTNRFVLQKSTIQLKSDEVETGKGIFDYFEEEIRGWKLGNLDIQAKKEQAQVGYVNKYRYFDSLEKTWHSFLREDLPNSYDCFCLFDTYKRILNVYDRTTYGKKTGWTISRKNIVNNINKNSNTKEIVTKLYVYGKDNLSINEVNPLGDYVLNYDYVKKEMSLGLQNALEVYEREVKILFDAWMAVYGTMQELNAQKIKEESKKTALDEVLKVKRAEQAVLITNKGKNKQEIDANNLEVARVYSEIENIKIQIDQSENTIKSIDSQITAKQDSLNDTRDKMQIENIQYNGNKIFNDNTLEELDRYTYVDKQQNEVFYTSQALYIWAKERIKEISTPSIEFKIDSNDFTSKVKNYKGYKQKIVLGDTITITDEKTGTDEVRFISYTYKPDIVADKIDLVFSTTDRQEEKKSSISTSMKTSADTKNYLDTQKWDWIEASGQTDYVKGIREKGLNTGINHIFSKNNKNEINMDGNGQWFFNAYDRNKVMVLTSGNIVISNDGLRTAKTVIDSSGIYADNIVGKVVAGENLYISNKNNDFRIDENGMYINVKKLQIGFSDGISDIESKIKITNDLLEVKVENLDKSLGTRISVEPEAVRIAWNQISRYIEFRDGKVFARQPDGSYFELGVDGIKKHTANGNYDLHYLTWVGSCTTIGTINGISYVSLPDDFRGKDWSSFVSIYDSYNSGGEDECLQKIIGFTSEEDKVNNRVGIRGYTNTINRTTGRITTGGIGVRVMVTA